MTALPNSLRQQRGVGLVEVLVAVLVLALGMLGVAAMQAMALRNNQSALQRSAAITQTYAILDVLRVDRDNASTNKYDLTFAPNAPDGGSFIQNELRRWVLNTKAALGQIDDTTTQASIVCGTNQCSISVRWDDSRGSAGKPETVTTVSRL